jgi:hypothetical protein
VLSAKMRDHRERRSADSCGSLVLGRAPALSGVRLFGWLGIVDALINRYRQSAKGKVSGCQLAKQEHPYGRAEPTRPYAPGYGITRPIGRGPRGYSAPALALLNRISLSTANVAMLSWLLQDWTTRVGYPLLSLGVGPVSSALLFANTASTVGPS